ncbi:hypothetical protein U1Q18_044686 [Sarracenia purpurea var. burkii]
MPGETRRNRSSSSFHIRNRRGRNSIGETQTKSFFVAFFAISKSRSSFQLGFRSRSSSRSSSFSSPDRQVPVHRSWEVRRGRLEKLEKF